MDPETLWSPYAGSVGNFRLRSTLGLDWLRNEWGLNWKARYFSGATERCSPNRPCNREGHVTPDLGKVNIRKLRATTFHDLQVRYHALWNATISVGADNVFNHRGPIFYSAPNSSFPYYGDFDIGRMAYLRYQQKF